MVTFVEHHYLQTAHLYPVLASDAPSSTSPNPRTSFKVIAEDDMNMYLQVFNSIAHFILSLSMIKAFHVLKHISHYKLLGYSDRLHHPPFKIKYLLQEKHLSGIDLQSAGRVIQADSDLSKRFKASEPVPPSLPTT
jgi:hypothetical protein